MTRHSDRKHAARALRDRFGIGLQQAVTALNDHVPPTGDDFATAQAETADWDPLHYAAVTTSTVPSELMDGTFGESRGVFALAVPDPVTAGPTPPGPDGVLGMSVRPTLVGEPPEAGLLVEAVAIREGADRRVPGLWRVALDILLQEQGWRYNLDTYLPEWRVDLTPVKGRPSALVGVKIHHPASGTVLFEAHAALPPLWLTAARVHPLGLQVIAGPLSGTRMPHDFSDPDHLDDLLGTAAICAARVPLHITPVDPDPDLPDVPAPPAAAEDDEEVCDICTGPGEECGQCDYEYEPENCLGCHGTGYVIPAHCCICGGSPYCDCCSTCGGHVGTCRCPVRVQLQDGGVKTL